MKTKAVSVSRLFKTNVQYNIPLFQRYYVWDGPNQWEPLWSDILQRNSSQEQGNPSSHFTGAIVIQHRNTLAGNVPKYDIIDGQQRLTTFQIILCAIRDICKLKEHKDIESEVCRYIQNKDEKDELLVGDERYKLIPTERDRDPFKALIDGRKSRRRILSAYGYFHGEITSYVNGDKEKIQRLFYSILNLFGFVQILIDDEDRPEKIFESLNARAKSLFEFDLLRNNLFLRAREDRDSLYKKYWEDFEDPYWDPEETDDGTSCELFLQHFLMAKLGKEGVKPEFFVYEREYLKDLRDATIEYEFSELKRYSEVYREMVDCNENSPIGKRMKFYQTFGLTTLHPFILFLTCEVRLKGVELDHVFNILESYTIRRMLCFGGKGGLKRFNIFFSQLIKGLQDNFSLDKFTELLAKETSDTNKYPRDDEIRPALHTRFDQDRLPFPDDTTMIFPGNMLVRSTLEGLWFHRAGQIKQRLIRYILYRIELMKRDQDKFTENLSFEDNLTTLEHIMPNKWKDTWSLPVAADSVRYDTNTHRVSVNRDVQSESKFYANLFSDDSKNELTRVELADESYSDAYNLALARDDLLQSIGNLTLVARELNAKLGNRTFSDKKKALDKHSSLKLNNEICQKDAWDVNEIHERAEKLIVDVCEIWPSLDWFRGE